MYGHNDAASTVQQFRNCRHSRWDAIFESGVAHPHAGCPEWSIRESEPDSQAPTEYHNTKLSDWGTTAYLLLCRIIGIHVIISPDLTKIIYSSSKLTYICILFFYAFEFSGAPIIRGYSAKNVLGPSHSCAVETIAPIMATYLMSTYDEIRSKRCALNKDLYTNINRYERFGSSEGAQVGEFGSRHCRPCFSGRDRTNTCVAMDHEQIAQHGDPNEHEYLIVGSSIFNALLPLIAQTVQIPKDSGCTTPPPTAVSKQGSSHADVRAYDRALQSNTNVLIVGFFHRVPFERAPIIVLLVRDVENIFVSWISE